MDKYFEALKKLDQAECNAVAELMDEFSSSNPHVTDENGNWMSKEDVVKSARDDWKKRWK